MDKPDILLFLSDQHGYQYTGFGGHPIVRTPNLDRIAGGGTVFENTYTSCPLCVPARMSLLSCQLPSRLGAFTNQCSLPLDKATFLHCLANAGYETVLCGRMHFLGADQRHGFTRRIFGDITSLHWGKNRQMEAELGQFNGTLGEKGCRKIAAGGNSPVLEYDRAVIGTAIDHLKRGSGKPQCLVVGTYAPHFPYVAPPELFEEYLVKADSPRTLDLDATLYHPATKHKEQESDEALLRRIRAAYYGMITHMDAQVGAVHRAYQDYLARNGKRGVFVYTSDHGDQIGERKLYGKKTFFEGSARIPLLFQGEGVKQNVVLGGAASLMDVGLTLCELAGAESPPSADGTSLAKALASGEGDDERCVVCEFIDEKKDGTLLPGRMLKQGDLKFISYRGYEAHDLLFDTRADPFEVRNLAQERESVLARFRRCLWDSLDLEGLLELYREKKKNHAILSSWPWETSAIEAERYKIPLCAVGGVDVK